VAPFELLFGKPYSNLGVTHFQLFSN